MGDGVGVDGGGMQVRLASESGVSWSTDLRAVGAASVLRKGRVGLAGGGNSCRVQVGADFRAAGFKSAGGACGIDVGNTMSEAAISRRLSHGGTEMGIMSEADLGGACHVSLEHGHASRRVRRRRIRLGLVVRMSELRCGASDRAGCQ
jgi:hypothetical protein